MLGRIPKIHIDRDRIRFLGLGALIAICALFLSSANADTYLLTSNGDNVIGGLGLVEAAHEDTISDLAYVYDQGYQEMRLANPSVDPWLPKEGTEVVVPSLFILPDAPREGIVINIPEMRLYYFPKTKAGETQAVVTYPISIGRQDWTTPLGLSKVVNKKKDPTWRPPESIRREHAAEGDILPELVVAGPDNPLGQYALYLSRNGYLIHGTDKPYGIGMRVTHGCIRLYPKDIEQLFAQVSVGTPVYMVNQPFKLGWLNGALYLEVHPYLEEHTSAFADGFTQVNGQITKLTQTQRVEVDWDQVQKVIAERTGIPTVISTKLADPDLLVTEEVLIDPAKPEDLVESIPDL